MHGLATLLLFALFTGVSTLSDAEAAAEVVSRDAAPEAALSGLRLTKVIRIPLRLRVNEIRDGKVIPWEIPPADFSSIYATKGRAPAETQDLSVGDLIPRTNYLITRITPKMRLNQKTGVREDVSEIALRNVRTMAEFLVTVGKTTELSETMALLEFSNGGKPLRVQVGDTFEFPAGSGSRYHVLKIEMTHMILRRAATGEHVRIVRTPGPPSNSPP